MPSPLWEGAFLFMPIYPSEQVRAVEWGKTSQWSVRFLTKEPPEPFSGWFPATKVTVPSAYVETRQMDGPTRKYSFPAGVGEPKISVTFYDDAKGTLHAWLKAWMRGMVGDGAQTLEECSRILEYKNSATDSAETPLTFLVFPTGGLAWEGTNEPTPIEYTVEFIVVG